MRMYMASEHMSTSMNTRLHEVATFLDHFQRISTNDTN